MTSYSCYFVASSSVFLLCCCVVIALILHYLKTLSLWLCVSIVHVVSGKYCCHCFSQYMSGLLVLVGEKLLVSTEAAQHTTEKSNHILLVKTGKRITLGWKQWPNPLILTDMDECECMSLCASIWHMQTICAVFVCYAQAHVTSSQLMADACACWCVIVAKMLCVKPELFIEITAPCGAYCVCERCEAGFHLSS